MPTPRTLLTLSIAAAVQMIAWGCAGTTSTNSSSTSTAECQQAGIALTQPAYRPVAAAALAFDPPISFDQPLPDMSRDGRAPSAFVGYEDAVTTYSATFQRDEIRGFHGHFDRQSNSVRTSVTTR